MPPVSDWSTTASSNTSVGGVSIAEGMSRASVNNAMRGMMAELKTYFDSKEIVTVFDPPFNAVGDGVTDDADAVEAWSDYISANKCAAICVGHFALGRPVAIGPSSGLSETRNIIFDAVFETTYTDTTATALTIRNMQFATLQGEIYVVCGDNALNTRRQRHGIEIVNCSRAILDQIYVEGTVRQGIIVNSQVGVTNNNLVSLQKARVLNSGYVTQTTVSTSSNSGSNNSRGQRTLVTPAVALPADLSARDWLIHDGEPYFITAVDHGAGTVEVFPWVVGITNGDAIQLVVRGGFGLYGGDSNIWTIGHIDVANSPAAMDAACLFPMNIEQFHWNIGTVPGGSYGVGFTLGSGIVNSSEGGTIDNFYCEGGAIAFVGITNVATSFAIGSMTADPAGLSAFRQLSANTGSAAGYDVLGVTIANHDGRRYGFSGSRPYNQTSSTVTAAALGTEASLYTARSNNPTFQLYNVETANKLFGFDTVLLAAWGTGTNNAPTGTVTINAANGATVNGQSSITYTSLRKPGFWQCHYDTANDDWAVQMIGGSYEYRSGAGAPSANANFIGEDYLDTTGGLWYKAKATGTGASDWAAL